MTTPANLFLVLAAAPIFGGCSRTGLDLATSDSYTEPDGALINGDDTGLFVGQWICNDTDTTTIPRRPIVYPTNLVTFIANSNGTLSMTVQTLALAGVPVDGGVTPVSPCATFTDYVWGSTAIVFRGTCSYEDDNYTLTVTTVSGAFTISGKVAAFDLIRNVTGSPPGTDTLTGTCTHYMPDAGSD